MRARGIHLMCFCLSLQYCRDRTCFARVAATAPSSHLPSTTSQLHGAHCSLVPLHPRPSDSGRTQQGLFSASELDDSTCSGWTVVSVFLCHVATARSLFVDFDRGTVAAWSGSAPKPTFKLMIQLITCAPHTLQSGWLSNGWPC